MLVLEGGAAGETTAARWAPSLSVILSTPGPLAFGDMGLSRASGKPLAFTPGPELIPGWSKAVIFASGF